MAFATVAAAASPVRQPINIDDVLTLRRIDTLSVSPDGRRFAIFVRQADPATNDYRTGWFVGDVEEDRLIYVGDGGRVGPRVRATGHAVGEVVGSESRWSPDGQWIAYTLERDGELQLWRSRADGTAQRRMTRNAADVREFDWSEDGRSLYFTVDTPRAELREQDLRLSRAGYQYDEDLWSIMDFLLPQRPRALVTDPPLWVVTVADRQERLADASQRKAFEQQKAREAGGKETPGNYLKDAAIPPVVRADGAFAWLERSAPNSRVLHLLFSAAPNSKPVRCAPEKCSGVIKKIWWSQDGQRVYFWRGEGLDATEQGVYAWSPESGAVATMLRAPDDKFDQCAPAAADRLICIRETSARAPHLIRIDLRQGELRVLADVNPRLNPLARGKIERFEWPTPKLAWNDQGGELAGLYPDHAYGYILYPPDFDPHKKYPVFIDPYAAQGFNPSVGFEHALPVYAARGFIVLNTAFPWPTDEAARLGAGFMTQLYSAELDFPHLTMLMESTLRALDTVAARGFIDQRRVGIGGVSHGTFVPLYMLQKHDRIAAISIAGPGWGPLEYYLSSRSGRQATAALIGKVGYGNWPVKPEGPGREFWSKFDIADHVETIEAPILMHSSAAETFGLLRFIRHLADADKPYDAYVYPGETHIKWQPAHLRSIMNRNLDWFRFWLQGLEDPDPVKKGQCARWRALHELQIQIHANRDRSLIE